jgi:hypothetical protein
MNTDNHNRMWAKMYRAYMSNLKNQLETAMPGRNVVLSENPFDSFSLIHSGLSKSEVEENAKYEEPDFLFEQLVDVAGLQVIQLKNDRRHSACF